MGEIMKHINITNADIVRSMSDEVKHNLATQCLLNNVEPEDFIEPIKNIFNSTINFAIDICNNFFETPAGKEYLNMRKKIEMLGDEK